jgi:hypothetical protein
MRILPPTQPKQTDIQPELIIIDSSDDEYVHEKSNEIAGTGNKISKSTIKANTTQICKVIYKLIFGKLPFEYFLICLNYYFVITIRLFPFNTNHNISKYIRRSQL